MEFADEQPFGLARCVRCGVMYEQSEESSCYYHPGHYLSPNGLRPPAILFWSCCSNHEERSKGCARGASHVRCDATARALSNFPQEETMVGLRRRAAAAAQAATMEEVPSKKSATRPEDAIKYTVVLGDTLATIALKHGMNVANLKKWNTLLSPNLYPGQQLYVKPPRPQTPAEIRSAALKLLMKKLSCTLPEASYYLDEHGGGIDTGAAIAAFAADGPSGAAVKVALGEPVSAGNQSPSGDGWVVVGAE